MTGFISNAIVSFASGSVVNDYSVAAGLETVSALLSNLSSIVSGSLRIDEWQPNESLTSSWTTVYSTSNSGVLYDAIWHVNSDVIDVRLTIDDQVIFTLGLDDLRDDYGFKNNKLSQDMWLVEYARMYWRFKPPEPALFNTLKFEMKSDKKGKRLERGLIMMKVRAT